jgi:hypothetical protein
MLEARDVLGTVCDSVLAELVVEATGISTPDQVKRPRLQRTEALPPSFASTAY